MKFKRFWRMRVEGQARQDGWRLWLAALLGLTCAQARAAEPAGLAPGVRGLATRAPQSMKIDGDLSEFKGAFCTPVEYHNADVKNRAAQFFYMWDDQAFYAGLRTLDTRPANHAPDDRLWEGDGVEWYFDTRQGASFRSTSWPTNASAGAVHCYWVGLKGTNVQARFCLRPGYLEAIPKTGVEVAARRTTGGMEVEFKLPWANFPGFKPAANAQLGIDAELCYSDGGPRVFRTFAYGSPLSVQQPASLARIQLVDRFEPAHWRVCAPVMAPVRCDTAWAQSSRPLVTAFMALPPDHASHVGKVLFRLQRLDGSALGEYVGRIDTFAAEGNFQRAVAQWPSDDAPAGSYHLTGVLFDVVGRELARVAPRMLSVNMIPGY